MLNHWQKRLTFDPDQYQKAGERRNERARKAAEVEREVERQLNLKPITKEQSKELNQTARELRTQERLIEQIGRFRDKNLDEYYARGFDKVYAHLTSTE